jgi:hypothetical protein
LCAQDFTSPAIAEVDGRFIVSGLLFGTGRGLVGYCPAPVLASLGFGDDRTLLFILAMLIGMTAFTAFDRLVGWSIEIERHQFIVIEFPVDPQRARFEAERPKSEVQIQLPRRPITDGDGQQE